LRGDEFVASFSFPLLLVLLRKETGCVLVVGLFGGAAGFSFPFQVQGWKTSRGYHFQESIENICIERKKF